MVTPGSGSRNVVSGDAGVVVQAGVVHGGVHLAARARPAPVVPRQLPAAPGAFAGRVGELAALDRALTGTGPAFGTTSGTTSGTAPVAAPPATTGTATPATSSSTATGTGTAVPDPRTATTPGEFPPDPPPGVAVVISAIGGAGGIGKTWLALTWAHRNLHRFPDGQLFVDLRGFSPTGRPTEPADAVRGFLDALGVDPGGLPAELDALAALYRSLVAGRRMLVVLDNAATTDQVVPLLPGSASCTVLVTGRTTLPALIGRHGARHLPLGVPTHAEARDLLALRLGEERIAAEPGVTDELIGLCGGHPLALAITARHAATRPAIPLAEFAAELRDLGLDVLDDDNDDDPAAGLPAVLSWSLRHLTDRHRTVFALLGIAPGPDIDLPAATSLTGLPAARARKALRVLEDHSLLDRHPRGRYSMHDLVRAYAATTAHELPEPVRRAALDRVVDFHLHTALAADHLLYPRWPPPVRLDPPTPGTRPHPLPDHPAALAWLDTHHPHLLAAQHTAAAQHRHQVAWHLAWALSTFHYRRGHRRDDVAVWRTAADSAGHLPDPTHRTLAHRFLGHAHAALGRHDQAMDHLHRALALAEQHHDPAQLAHTHFALVRAWRREDDGRALEHARHALDLYRALDQPVWEATALNSMGWHAARLGDHDTARDHCEAALVLFRRHRIPDGEAATLDSLGFIDHRTGHHRRAVDRYRQALALFRTLGDTTETANTLDGLGHPHAALGHHDEARAVWREALELYRDQGRDADADRVRRQLDALDPTPEPDADARNG
ncbi:tetratricopeptide repeat protein [Saccharothrix sp. BKS2]|uniref:ATP-binding protein n=1 Tax=Saccharothrix sp. BKS2 TaxID=3064400 RepID=UPI0039E9ED53